MKRLKRWKTIQQMESRVSRIKLKKILNLVKMNKQILEVIVLKSQILKIVVRVLQQLTMNSLRTIPLQSTMNLIGTKLFLHGRLGINQIELNLLNTRRPIFTFFVPLAEKKET